MHKGTAPLVLFMFALVTPAWGAEPGAAVGTGSGASTPTDPADFKRHVQPFLTKYCADCHGAEKAKADFTLHDIDGQVTAGKDVVRWEKVLEMLSLGDMPPRKAEQPGRVERERITTWIAAELKKIGRGHDEAKLALPHQANRISHEDLFSGKHKGPAWSPARLWRKSPQIYDRFARDMRTAIAQPLLGLGGKGIQDYATLYADEATIQTMLRNSSLVVDNLMNRDRAMLNHLFKEGADPKPEDVDRAINNLFKLIFDREPTQADRERYIDGLFKKNYELGGLAIGMRSLVVAMLMSQEFVFRLEVGLGPQLPDGRRQLNPTELTYAISYAFFDQPDRELLQAAQAGRLETRDDVRREVLRILETPDEKKQYWHYPMYHRWGDDYYSHRPRVLRFFQEYFGYTGVVDVFKDMQRNPEHQANRLRKDADMLVLQVLERDRDVLAELLTTNRYPMDYVLPDQLKRLHNPDNNQYRGIREKYADEIDAIIASGKWPGIGSRHVSAYNLSEERADAIRRAPGDPVVLPKDQRAGMLTHPAWLVAHSGNFDNDPIRRGKWIREHLLADLLPEVPIGVDAKVPEDPHRTLKERLDLVRAEACWRCHKKMNPLGETFESYDDFGRYRQRIVLGDADAYFKAKRKHDEQKSRWEDDLAKWKSYDAKARAAKVAHAEAMLASLKKPDLAGAN